MSKVTKPWFEVDHKGMRELHSGRESWQLIKELVSNSFDEETASQCIVTLTATTDRQAQLTVTDNGRGFKDIKDAWTLMAHTSKRESATVRGRFNIGEKELLCTAKSAVIITSGYKVSFSESGRRVTKCKATSSLGYTGTSITANLYLGNRQVETALSALKKILPPKHMDYEVNGEVVNPKHPDKVITASLETAVWRDGAETHPKRETGVEIFRIQDGKGWLYEMGIPVQEIDCPYGVNVLQKIPMPPNRDVVKDSYLQDIYTLVLNTMSDEVQTPSASWVHTAMEDKDIKPEAVKDIITNRYGTDKVVLWSANPKSNDEARQQGYEVVHGRTLSEAERTALQEKGGVAYSGTAFPTSFKSVDKIPVEKWTDGMKHTATFAKFFHDLLLHRPLEVEFYSDMQIPAMASYSTGYLEFNKVHCGNSFFDNGITAKVVSLLLHEFAHNVTDSDSEHSPRWYAEMQRLAGLAVKLAVTDTRLMNYLLEVGRCPR